MIFYVRGASGTVCDWSAAANAMRAHTLVGFMYAALGCAQQPCVLQLFLVPETKTYTFLLCSFVFWLLVFYWLVHSYLKGSHIHDPGLKCPSVHFVWLSGSMFAMVSWIESIWKLSSNLCLLGCLAPYAIVFLMKIKERVPSEKNYYIHMWLPGSFSVNCIANQIRKSIENPSVAAWLLFHLISSLIW